MPKYSYARIAGVREKGISLETANQQLLAWAETEIRKAYPGCAITKYPHHFSKISKIKLSHYAFEFNRLDGDDPAVAWWLLDLMCQVGWQLIHRVDGINREFPYSLVIDLKLEIPTPVNP